MAEFVSDGGTAAAIKCEVFATMGEALVDFDFHHTHGLEMSATHHASRKWRILHSEAQTLLKHILDGNLARLGIGVSRFLESLRGDFLKTVRPKVGLLIKNSVIRIVGFHASDLFFAPKSIWRRISSALRCFDCSRTRRKTTA